jgi:hypothetical protein
MKNKVVLLFIIMSIIPLSACGNSPTQAEGELYEISPLEPNWTREQLNKDPTAYNVSELLPKSATTSSENQDSNSISPQQLLFYKTDTFVYSRYNTTSGNAYLGRLVNQSEYETTVNDTFSWTWSSSVSGGIDVWKIKSAFSILSSYTYSKSVSTVIPSGGRVDVYGQATGELIYGWQENKLVGTYGCSSANYCTSKDFSAFVPQGMSIKLY